MDDVLLFCKARNKHVHLVIDVLNNFFALLVCELILRSLGPFVLSKSPDKDMRILLIFSLSALLRIWESIWVFTTRNYRNSDRFCHRIFSIAEK